VLDQLELGLGVIARPQQLARWPCSSSICAGFLSPLATSQRPRASDQLTLRFSCPAPVATTVVANSGHTSVGSIQRFLVIHAATYNAFYHQRHVPRRSDYKHLRSGAFATWAQASAV
jgi:hypothetical protein